MSQPILEAREIGRFAAEADSWLIRHVALCVAAGERIALTGPSGSGKTVLLRALALLDPLTEGELLWNGHAVRPEQIPLFRSQVVYLHQRPALIDGTVEDNLRYPFTLSIHGRRKFNADKVIHWLRVLGRDRSFLGKHTRDLSGGEAQITALFRAMQLEPSSLLLDEPTAALDSAATASVEQCVLQWQSEDHEKRSVVIVSHDVQQGGRLADRVLRLQSGRLTPGA